MPYGPCHSLIGLPNNQDSTAQSLPALGRFEQALVIQDMGYSTVGCRRTCTWSQPRSFLFFKTPANLVLIFQSVFESCWLACSAHTVGDDACRAGNAAEMFQTVELESFHSQQCRRRSRLHSKRCLRVVRLFLQPGVVLIFDEIPAWPFFGKPFFGTRQYCMLFSAEKGDGCSSHRKKEGSSRDTDGPSM